MTPPSTTSRTLLANARILACDGDRDERPFDGDILIEGSRIARVSHGRLGSDPAGTRVVDLRTATVLPGLGDAHVHTSWPLDFVFDHAAVAATPEGRHGDLPYDDAVRLAQSVQSVKGYAQVKEAAVTQWRSAVAALLDHAPDPVRAGNPQG